MNGTMMTTEIEDLKMFIDSKQQELTQLMQTEFHKGLGRLFETYPQIETIRWNQYTPYFNDGDVCEFSVNVDPDYGLTINGTERDEFCEFDKVEDSNTWSGYRYDRRITNPDMYNLFEPVSDFLSAFGEDYMKQAFGDHAEITIDRQGVTVERYDHD